MNNLDSKEKLLAYMRVINNDVLKTVKAIVFYRNISNSSINDSIDTIESLAEQAGWDKQELSDFDKGLLLGMLLMLLLCAAIFLLIN